MMSASEYRETAKSLGLTYTDMGGDTNFLEEIERNVGLTQNHNISFSSGTDTSSLRVQTLPVFVLLWDSFSVRVP